MKWVVGGLAAAILIVVAAGIGTWWYRAHTDFKDVRGSATVEFDPAEPPPTGDRPPEAVRTVPWPTYGYDEQRTHAAPFRVRPPFRTAWSWRSGGILEYPPVVAYGRIYGAHERGLFFALDAETGRVVWQRHFPHCAAASPTVGDGVVYMAFLQPLPCAKQPRTQHGLVVALRASDGKVLWRLDVSAVESSLLLVHGLLYFGAWDHAVYAVDAETGKQRWRVDTDGEHNSSPAYVNGKVVIGNNAGSVYALDARTGAVRWRAASHAGFLHGHEYFYAAPTIAYGRVFMGNTDGVLYAFGATTGQLLWARRLGTYVYTAPAVWKQKVYAGTYDGRFYALDAATGDVVWVRDAPSAIHGAPTVLDGLVYFATCGTCGSRGVRYAKRGPALTIALDAQTGQRVWTFRDGRYSPVVADSMKVYLSGQSVIYGLVPRSR